MNFNKKLLTLLAIFCVIASAGIVCAADFDGGYAGSHYYENEHPAYADQNGLEPGNGLPIENQTGYVPVNAAGEPINATGNMTNTTNNTAANTTNVTNSTTANATHNVTAPHSMLATGNPIVALLAVSAIAGGYAVLRRK